MSKLPLCLCCGTETSPKQRRILKSESNSDLIPVLSYFIKRALREAGRGCSDNELLSVLNGGCDSLGYIYRDCHTQLSRHHKTDMIIAEKVKVAVTVASIINFSQQPTQDDLNSCQELISSQENVISVARKRKCSPNMYTQTSSTKKILHQIALLI